MTVGLIDRLVETVLRLDPGGQARLRRGSEEPELLLIPALGGLLGSMEDDQRRWRHLLVARIAAILGADRGNHPGVALARADFHERRMSRLLASEPEVLPERLLVAARYLAAKRERCRIAPFFWFLEEASKGERTSERAGWARRYGQERNRIERRKSSMGDIAIEGEP